MHNTLDQLINFQQSQALINHFSTLIGLPVLLIDRQGMTPLHTRWKEKCTACPQRNARYCSNCPEAPHCHLTLPHPTAPISLYQCPRGLVNASAPIFIGGEHVADVFVGQVYLDSDASCSAVPDPFPRVPVADEAQLNSILSFLKTLTEMIAAMGAERHQLLEQQAEASALAAIVESSDDAIYSKDPDFRITSWNRGAERLFGYTAEEALGQDVEFLFLHYHKEEHDDIRNQIRSAVQLVNIDTVCWRKDGRMVNISLKISPIQNAQGVVVGSSTIARDITEQKKTEEALKQSETQYRLLFENAMDSILLMEEGRFVDCNKNAVVTFGYPREQLIGHSPADFSPEYQPDGTHSADKAAQKMALALHGIPQFFLWVHMRQDGTCFSSEISLNRLEHPGKVQLLAMVRDVTARIHAEKEARRNEMRMTCLLQIMQQEFHTRQELLDYALEELVAQTESKIGYIYYYDEIPREFILHAWSKNAMKECQILEPAFRYALDKTGIWGEAVRQARPIIVNDFAAPNPFKRGYPDGHPILYKFMTVPIFSEGRSVAVGGVANKETDYTESDVRQITLILESVWRIHEQKTAEQNLRVREEQLRMLSNNIPNSFFVQILQDAAAMSCQYASEGIFDLTGLHADDVMQDLYRALQCIHPRDLPQIAVKRDRALQTLSRFSHEFRLLPRDTTIRWVRAQAAPRRLENGTVVWDCFVFDVTEQKSASEERERLIHQLQEALAEVQTLSGLLPICAQCKKIRDDMGYWTQIEEYLHVHSKARFSHGICPECARQLYPDLTTDM